MRGQSEDMSDAELANEKLKMMLPEDIQLDMISEVINVREVAQHGGQEDEEMLQLKVRQLKVRQLRGQLEVNHLREDLQLSNISDAERANKKLKMKLREDIQLEMTDQVKPSGHRLIRVRPAPGAECDGDVYD
jgi:hypothetical protein